MGDGDQPQRTNILLPSEEHVVLSWKAKPGAHVQQGETIAIACHKKDAALLKETVGSAPKASTAHKRPKRGRRIVPASATAKSTAPVAKSSNINTQSLHQKLAERLSKSNSGSQQQQSPADDSASITSSESSAATPKKGPAETTTTPIFSPAKGFLRKSKDDDLSTNATIIGYIEQCTHPTFFDGMCVVCGSSKTEMDENDSMSPLSAPPLTAPVATSKKQIENTLVTVEGGITMSISHQESQKMAERETERLLAQNKLCLVLDLDHTLLHATPDPRAHPYSISHDDVRTLRLPVVLEAPPNGPPPPPPHQPMWMTHYVKLRPHLKEFLNSVRDTYELTVYTAGTRQYAEEITIVLCRYLVGTKRDAEHLERLRYDAAVTQAQYDQRLQQEGKRKADEIHTEGGTNSDDTNKNGSDGPPNKKKKVSFGGSEVNTYDTSSSANAGTTRVEEESLETLKEKLEMLKAQLKEADDLEKQAWELRQTLFGSRVVSRTDVGDLGRDVKSLNRIFPGGGTMAAVVDDREDVWANAQDNSDATIKGEPPSNLLLVKPYHYQAFVGFADVNNSAGADLSGTTAVTQEDDDVQLLWTSQILKDLHKLYYSQHDNGTRQTVPQLLARMRRSVLKGTVLVLSGLVPLHKKEIGVNEPRPPIVRYAETLGAQLQNNVDAGVTHVVAAKDGTDKAIAARKFPRTVLVRPSWLVECYWSMTRRRSLAHLLSPTPATTEAAAKPPQEASRFEDRGGGGETSSSGDEDDLAAEFEEELMND
eukprot:scaffold1475_cov111-Cylindrotheca_fusiformis.AAC.9